MPKFNFNLRSREIGKPSPLYLIARWNRRRLVYPTGEAIDPQFWCHASEQRNFQRAKETRAFPEHPEFNRRIDLLERTAKDVFRQFESDNNRVPEPGELRSALDKALNRDNTSTPREFMAFVEHFIRKAADRIQSTSGQRLAQGTVRKYRTALHALVEFAKARNQSLSFHGIDMDFYTAYTKFLTNKGLAPNTVGIRIKTLKVFLNAATEEGVNTNRTFQSRKFRAPVEITDKVYLTEPELQELYDLDLSTNKRLERVRDLFLVGAYTGLRFGDLSVLRPEHVRNELISIHMAKTGRKVAIPVNAVVRAIMTKYAQEDTTGLPPAPSNQKMNDYLKEVCQLAPSLRLQVPLTLTIRGQRVRSKHPKWELVTTHTARRSFASNLYLKGAPARTTMAITGHRTEQAFLAYIRLEPEEHANILKLYMEPKVLLKAS